MRIKCTLGGGTVNDPTEKQGTLNSVGKIMPVLMRPVLEPVYMTVGDPR